VLLAQSFLLVEVLRETLGQVVRLVLQVHQGLLVHRVLQVKPPQLGLVKRVRLVLTAGMDRAQLQLMCQEVKETLVQMVQQTLPLRAVRQVRAVLAEQAVQVVLEE
jgi:hypothetical protein